MEAARASVLSKKRCRTRRGASGRRCAGVSVFAALTAAAAAVAVIGVAFCSVATSRFDDFRGSRALSQQPQRQQLAPTPLAGGRHLLIHRLPRTLRPVQGGRNGFQQGQPGSSGNPYAAPGQPGGPMGNEDPMKQLMQLLGGQVPPGTTGAGGMPGMGGPGGDSFMSMLMGGAGGAGGGAGGLGGGFGGLGGGQQKKPSDAFFTERFPVLQKAKLVVLPLFFAFCYYRGWVGTYGLIQGAMSKSYYDMLAVPLRIMPQSPLYEKAFFITQMWCDLGFRAVGFLINLARGKAKLELPKMPPMPPQQGNFGGMPPPPPMSSTPGSTASTTTSSGPYYSGSSPASPSGRTPGRGGPSGTGRPGGSEPPIIDADVTFLN